MSRALARRYGKSPSGPVRVQALLFPRSDWATSDALAWARVNGFRTSDVTKSASYLRIRQTDGDAKVVKTIPFGPNGMRAVVEWR